MKPKIEKTQWRSNARFDCGAIFVILVCHLATFSGHYLGYSIFPWDFQSAGYHAQTAAWFRDGTVLSPPTWMPYGSMGFPAWWSVQSGAWYLPLQVAYLFGIKYDFFFAAAFQSAHVLLGAIAMYFLARLSGTNRPAACVAALVYHFSSIFFSNAQHVDIVRAAALMPLLLVCTTPQFILRSKLSMVLLSIVTFQFLIAAYPGSIVATFYTSCICIGFWTIQQERLNILKYLSRLSVAALSGALLAQVKYLPLILGAYSDFKTKPDLFNIKFEHLFTFLFMHDLPILSQDVTMQSLWSPPVALLLVFFLSRPKKQYALPLALITATLFMGMIDLASPNLRSMIPGSSLSRLPHSDWRPTLHVGMGLLSALFFQNISRHRLSHHEVISRSVYAFTFLFFMAALALFSGYKIAEIGTELCLLFTFVALLAATLYRRKLSDHRSFNHVMLPLTVVFIVVSSFVMHDVRVSRTWDAPWTEADERGYFGATVSELLNKPRQNEWVRRPPRQSYGADQLSASGQIDLRFNRAWYAQEFATFGYDNMRSSEFLDLLARISDPADGVALLQFLGNPGQIVFYGYDNDVDLDFAARCPIEADDCASGVSATGDIRSFGLRSNRFSITTSVTVKMVENEMFYKGWQGTLCDAAGNCANISASRTNQGLRSWTIPTGDWVLTTEYVTPHFWLAKILAVVGPLSLFALTLFESYLVRKRQAGSGNLYR